MGRATNELMRLLRWPSLLAVVLVAAFACAPLSASGSITWSGTNAGRDRAVQHRPHLTALQALGLSEPDQSRAPRRKFNPLFMTLAAVAAAFAICRCTRRRAPADRLPTQFALRVPVRGPPPLQIAG